MKDVLQVTSKIRGEWKDPRQVTLEGPVTVETIKVDWDYGLLQLNIGNGKCIQIKGTAEIQAGNIKDMWCMDCHSPTCKGNHKHGQ